MYRVFLNVYDLCVASEVCLKCGGAGLTPASPCDLHSFVCGASVSSPPQMHHKKTDNGKWKWSQEIAVFTTWLTE